MEALRCLGSAIEDELNQHLFNSYFVITNLGKKMKHVKDKKEVGQLAGHGEGEVKIKKFDFSYWA